MSFNIDEYVDVAQRIHDFYERFPDGRLVTVDWEVKPDLDGKSFVWVHAKAFRTADDPLPGDGLAWEPVPGPTQFTRDSELMNAQTAAWGRAIVALGFDTKKIASRQEVQARNGQQPVSTGVKGDGQTGGAASAYSGDPHGFRESRADNVATDKQKAMIRRLAKKLNLEVSDDLDSMSKSEASASIEELLKVEQMGKEAAAVGAPSGDLDDIPFAASEF